MLVDCVRLTWLFYLVYSFEFVFVGICLIFVGVLVARMGFGLFGLIWFGFALGCLCLFTCLVFFVMFYFDLII